MKLPELPELHPAYEYTGDTEVVGYNDCKEYARAYGEECARMEREQADQEAAVLRAQRDHACAQYERAMKIVCGIWALLSPDDVQSGGKTYRFVNPDANETLVELTRRIKAIPDEVGAIWRDAETKGPKP